jgi:hypothetical protein
VAPGSEEDEMAEARTLLLNYVYYNPAGHAAEALKLARGFRAANPGLEVHVALAQRTTWEVATAADWIAAVHPVDAAAFVGATEQQARRLLAPLPREWDYLVVNDWIFDDTAGQESLRGEELEVVSYHRAAGAYFVARRGAASPDYVVRDWLHRLPGLGYDAGAPVRLRLPEEAVAWVRERFPRDGPSACVLLGGSAGPAHYPAPRSWIRILRALTRAIPGLRLYLTGVRRREAGRTATTAYSEAQVGAILEAVPEAVDAYDLGLWRQLALVERSDLFLSPHTGFAFLAPCVGTPWLTLSGGNYCENFYNGVPFFRVLPDNPDYPYLGRLGVRYGARRPRIPCMRPDRIEQTIPRIVEGARLLLDPGFTFRDALARYRRDAARANVDRARLALEPTY